MRLLLIAPIVALAACESAPPTPTRTVHRQATYDRLLAGKVAGKPEMCLSSLRARDMVVIDDRTVLFRDGRTTWVNHIPGGCSNLGDPSYALVTRNVGPQLCRGDLAEVRDMSAGITLGACSLGEFVPYRPAR